MLAEPSARIEEVVLLAPEHSRERLPHHARFVLGSCRGRDGLVELVGLIQARRDYLIEVRERLGQLKRSRVREPQSQDGCLPWLHLDDAVSGSLGAGPRGVHCVRIAVGEQLVDSVLHEGTWVLAAEEALIVGFVLREQQRDVTINVEPAVAERGVGRGDDPRSALAGYLAKGWLRRLGPPAPGVAEPERWEQVKPGGFRSPVCDGDTDAEVLGCCLG